MDGNARRHFVEERSGREGAQACMIEFKQMGSDPELTP